MAPSPPSASSAGGGAGPAPPGFHVTVEFCGGLEQLTSTKKKSLSLTFARSKANLAGTAAESREEVHGDASTERAIKLYQLVSFLSTYVITERPELFAEAYEPCVLKSIGGAAVAGQSVRPSGASPGCEDDRSSGYSGTGDAVFSLDLLESGSLAPMRVRPGILSLVNDVDAEVEGGMEAPVPEGACVTFISTLHGG